MVDVNGIIDNVAGITTTTLKSSNIQNVKAQAAVHTMTMTTNQLWSIVFIVFGISVLLAIMVVVIYNNWVKKRFPYDITLKYVVNGRSIIRNTKARIKHGKGEEDLFVFKGGFYKPLKAPIPPDKATDVKGDGRKYAKGYVSDNNLVVWMYEEIPDLFHGEYQKVTESDAKKPLIEKIEGIPQQLQALWFNQMRKAERDKVNKLSQILLQILPYLILIIIMGMCFVFWKDITHPMIQAQALQVEMQDNDIKILDRLTVLYKMVNGTPLNQFDQGIFNESVHRFSDKPQVLT